ncbi:DnaJ-domain-containing protein [Mollisia scopiformis]|uniref:DnaJ-domain-containing protein n=1 Tax=Mollisia scopiformis TaxID=149040 RepID=A0A194XND0_MOLSC|nr:DnaJ-domain-containing protein [Mollisia scopiformis]KUJ21651.1 DnaJ-domain-containing protein [Mollisia scopiformis]
MAPPGPTFDLYKELELTAGATAADITASYRRLALLHHPDKNENSVEATAKFQRLNTAHEILKDTAQRGEYDRRSSGSNFGFSDAADFFNSEDGYDSADEFDPDLRDPFDIFWSHFDHRYGTPEPQESDTEEEKQKARDPARDQARDQAQEKAREAGGAREKQRQQDAEMATDKEKARRKENADKSKGWDEKKYKEPRQRQEQVWRLRGDTTPAAKQKSCPHIDFWPKEEGNKKGEKVKCGSCTKKRGTSFKCPLCDLVACQVCVSDFSKEREKAAKF